MHWYCLPPWTRCRFRRTSLCDPCARCEMPTVIDFGKDASEHGSDGFGDNELARCRSTCKVTEGDGQQNETIAGSTSLVWLPRLPTHILPYCIGQRFLPGNKRLPAKGRVAEHPEQNADDSKPDTSVAALVPLMIVHGIAMLRELTSVAQRHFADQGCCAWMQPGARHLG